MPASLWRHAQNEQRTRLHDERGARWLLGVLALLTVSSIAYGAWQLCSLMAGSHLQNAVAAIAR